MGLDLRAKIRVVGDHARDAEIPKWNFYFRGTHLSVSYIRRLLFILFIYFSEITLL